MDRPSPWSESRFVEPGPAVSRGIPVCPGFRRLAGGFVDDDLRRSAAKRETDLIGAVGLIEDVGVAGDELVLASGKVARRISRISCLPIREDKISQTYAVGENAVADAVGKYGRVQVEASGVVGRIGAGGRAVVVGNLGVERVERRGEAAVGPRSDQASKARVIDEDFQGLCVLPEGRVEMDLDKRAGGVVRIDVKAVLARGGGLSSAVEFPRGEQRQ